MDKRITDEIRARVLQIHRDNPFWDSKDIAKVIKGTEHEIADWAVAVVLTTKHYRDR